MNSVFRRAYHVVQEAFNLVAAVHAVHEVFDSAAHFVVFCVRETKS